MKKIFMEIKRSLNEICLIDKVLILYMLILLIYIAVHLLYSTGMQESTAVDTIIRTSASAIFGYFISNNFIKENHDKKDKNASDLKANNEISIKQTEIILQTDTNDVNSDKNSITDSGRTCSRLQILVVSGIGLISLILLLLSRNYTKASPEFSATVSQLRDFLSACIGFLVSCGKAK